MTSAVDHIALHARLSPERVAMRDLTHGRQWTYAELDQQAWRYLAELQAREVSAGDRVATLARNRAELVILQFACARLGALFAPLNWRLAMPEITALIENAGATLVLGDPHFAQCGYPISDIAAFDLAASGRESANRPRLDASRRPSLLLYTSGSTGKPKGVLHSEASLCETAVNFSLLGRVTHESVFLCDAPMFHIIGLATTVRAALMRGGRILVSDGFDAARSLARLSDHRLGVTHYFCVPQMAAALRSVPGFDPGPLRGRVTIFTGGAPQPQTMVRAWLADGVAVVDGYGMSELGTVFGMPIELAQIERRVGSVGVTTPGIETRIVDDRGRICQPGVAGELHVRSAGVTSGYWQLRDETDLAFSVDSWFRTGDIVRCDHDGFHWVIGRKKDMYISGGENVFPAEIEALLANYPGVDECAVIGIPDPQWGEVGCLFVVTRGRPTPDRRSITDFLKTKVARYKVPKRIEFIDALPRTASGKVFKATLRGIADTLAVPAASSQRR